MNPTVHFRIAEGDNTDTSPAETLQQFWELPAGEHPEIAREEHAGLTGTWLDIPRVRV